MDKRIKFALIAAVIVIALVSGFLIYGNFGQIGGLQYTVIEPPTDERLEMYAVPCTMEYWDNVSVHVGKAESPDDVVEKWTGNVAQLEKMAMEAGLGEELYGNFTWSRTLEKIELRYRTARELYSRDGWYIFTFSSSFLVNEDYFGQFFLSNDGVLMPAVQTCTVICCP